VKMQNRSACEANDKQERFDQEDVVAARRMTVQCRRSSHENRPGVNSAELYGSSLCGAVKPLDDVQTLIGSSTTIVLRLSAGVAFHWCSRFSVGLGASSAGSSGLSDAFAASEITALETGRLFRLSAGTAEAGSAESGLPEKFAAGLLCDVTVSWRLLMNVIGQVFKGTG
jgi:hypothetical protein